MNSAKIGPSGMNNRETTTTAIDKMIGLWEGKNKELLKHEKLMLTMSTLFKNVNTLFTEIMTGDLKPTE